MINNILSYFTKDINDPIELAKYTIDIYSNQITILYIRNVIWSYNNDGSCIIYNDVLNIYKRPVYEENKCSKYFHNMAKTYNTSF